MEGLGNFITQDYCWIRSDIADPRDFRPATKRTRR